MKYLTPKELEELLLESNIKEIKFEHVKHVETNNCKVDNNIIQLSSEEKLNKIIIEKQKKNSFLKRFLRKVF
tara:strand:+ start:284 stop:499 length:216 start_codon:yes stop_codon:yes gene_type:complete